MTNIYHVFYLFFSKYPIINVNNIYRQRYTEEVNKCGLVYT